MVDINAAIQTSASTRWAIRGTAQEFGAHAQTELRRTEFNFSGHRLHHMVDGFPGKIEFCTSELCPVTSESLISMLTS